MLNKVKRLWWHYLSFDNEIGISENGGLICQNPFKLTTLDMNSFLIYIVHQDPNVGLRIDPKLAWEWLITNPIDFPFSNGSPHQVYASTYIPNEEQNQAAFAKSHWKRACSTISTFLLLKGHKVLILGI